MQLTDWLASWLSRGRSHRRGTRRGRSGDEAASGLRSAAVELLERRSLPTALTGLGASSPDNLVNVDGTLFFNANDGSHGRELWKSDGTLAGTVLVKDIQAGSADGAVSGSRTAVAVGNSLFFVANDRASGAELWKSEGTGAGTVLVADVNAGATGSSPQQLTNVNGTLFFTADNGVNGRELWKSDGTSAGT
jgi:ELWxxDGT repeat protein